MAWYKRSPRPTASPLLTQGQARALSLTVAMVILPLAAEVPLWLALLSAAGIGWRGWLLWRKVPLPPGWSVNLVALGGAGAIGFTYRNLFGMTPGVALLCLFAALKLYETRNHRDGFVVLLLCLFLDLCQFFYSQSILTAVLMVAAVLMVVASLVLLQDATLSLRRLLATSGGLLLQAAPFMVLLFLLVPRIPGPLWGLPADAQGAQSGLSETMSPGSIGQLSQSEAIAFRVHFSAAMPTREQLYWRGPVLNDFDGHTWRMGATGSPLAAPPYPLNGPIIPYEITLEPHQRSWLLALDYPNSIPSNTLLTPAYQLISRQVLQSRQRFHLAALPGVFPGLDEDPRRLAQARRLPPGGNPRARQWAASLRQQHPADAALAAAILTRIRSDNFVYTLSPPLLGADSVDEFLFDTRRGFCEHYASAFVFLLRAAGIPARVVTGYQGGEINPVDGFLEVRQSDAHAWAEMWLSGKGWQRVDPTAAIAPERVEQNLAAALPAGEPRPVLAQPNFDWARQLRFRYEAVTNAWNQWVLGYDDSRQRALLNWLGLADDLNTLGALLASGTGLLLLAFTLWSLRQQQIADPLQRLWRDFTRRLARYGISIYPWEGPSAYADRLRARWPAAEGEISAICDEYQRLRYAPAEGGTTSRQSRLSHLGRRIQAFDPERTGRPTRPTAAD